jgi:hypothetical protein
MSWWWLVTDVVSDEAERPPFQYWVTASDRVGRETRHAICAVVVADDTDAAWALVGRHFPRHTRRFARAVAADWTMSNRFQ